MATKQTNLQPGDIVRGTDPYYQYRVLRVNGDGVTVSPTDFEDRDLEFTIEAVALTKVGEVRDE